MYNLQETLRTQGFQATWRTLKRHHMPEMIIVPLVIVVGGTILMAIAK